MASMEEIYSNWIIGLQIALAVIALAIGVYYIVRYIRDRFNTTLIWAIGYLTVSVGIVINTFIALFFSDFFISNNINSEQLFLNNGVLIFVGALVLSTFTLGLFAEKYEKLGFIVTLSLIVVGFTLMIISSIWFAGLYIVARVFSWIFAVWAIFFFSYLSFESRDIRIFIVTLGILFMTVAGILSATFEVSLIGVLANAGMVIGLGLIAFGLFYAHGKEEDKEEPSTFEEAPSG